MTLVEAIEDAEDHSLCNLFAQISHCSYSIHMKKIFLFLIIAVIVVGVALSVQQTKRAAANHPQIEMAKDAAARLAAGEVPAAIVPHEIAGMVDIAINPAPFMMIFDDKDTLLESSMKLG